MSTRKLVLEAAERQELEAEGRQEPGASERQAA